MDGHLICVDGSVHEPTVDSVKSLLDGGGRFWLDLVNPSQDDQDALLRDTFKFHPLALEDAAHFGQRPKIDTYEGFALLVVFGVNHSGRLVEVHCFYTEDYLITIHRDNCPAMEELLERLRAHAGKADHVMLLYRVVDTLVDGYFPVLSAMDDRIDDLEDEILVRPTEQQLGTLFDLKRSLISMRKVVTPQRDMFASLLSQAEQLPGMTPDAERYFRDLYDHLIRISDLVDSYRDLLTGALDTHLSTVSNRLNVVMKQLTIIATVFLPITFITGFFGQNFGWMINHITSASVFVVLGIGLQVAMVVGLMVLFKQRGWLAADASVPVRDQPSRTPIQAEHRWKVVHPRHLPGRAKPIGNAPATPGE
jgi:magnesium transporter